MFGFIDASYVGFGIEVQRMDLSNTKIAIYISLHLHSCIRYTRIITGFVVTTCADSQSEVGLTAREIVFGTGYEASRRLGSSSFGFDLPSAFPRLEGAVGFVFVLTSHLNTDIQATCVESEYEYI